MAELASASNYETFYFSLERILATYKRLIRTEKRKEYRHYYKHALTFFGFLKFLADYHDGYLGFLWL